MSERSTWVLIRRYDSIESEHAEIQTSLQKLTLTKGTKFDALRGIIFRLIAADDDGSRVLKIRRTDNNLIPLSSILEGSEKDNPFIIDVVAVHQFCPAERRTVLPGYVDAMITKFDDLEKRILLAEKAVPELTEAHERAVEEATLQLANCVAFLDRRLDELSPPEWKTQICSGI